MRGTAARGGGHTVPCSNSPARAKAPLGPSARAELAWDCMPATPGGSNRLDGRGVWAAKRLLYPLRLRCWGLPRLLPMWTGAEDFGIDGDVRQLVELEFIGVHAEGYGAHANEVTREFG